MATRVALVVAGGSGMGAAVAKTLAANGYQIGILSSSGKGQDLAEQLGGFGVTGSNLDVDVVESFINQSYERFGRIDGLVNSAGHGPKGSLLDLTDEQWRLGMDVYLMNVIRTVRIAAPLMLRSGGGSIVNISSFAAVEPSSVFPTSAVFRAGLSAFTKLFADEYAEKAIRINNVLPGFIDSLPEKEEFRLQIPMGRYGSVEEIAGTVSFLLSDDAAYITGQNIRVDGGLTRSI